MADIAVGWWKLIAADMAVGWWKLTVDLYQALLTGTNTLSSSLESIHCRCRRLPLNVDTQHEEEESMC